jgi:hypothetical protein
MTDGWAGRGFTLPGPDPELPAPDLGHGYEGSPRYTAEEYAEYRAWAEAEPEPEASL